MQRQRERESNDKRGKSRRDAFVPLPGTKIRPTSDFRTHAHNAGSEAGANLLSDAMQRQMQFAGDAFAGNASCAAPVTAFLRGGPAEGPEGT